MENPLNRKTIWLYGSRFGDSHWVYDVKISAALDAMYKDFTKRRDIANGIYIKPQPKQYQSHVPITPTDDLAVSYDEYQTDDGSQPIHTQEVQAWQHQRSDEVVKVLWQFKTCDARTKLKHLLSSHSDVTVY